MTKMKKDIAIVVLNYIQYLNIIPGINELIKKGYKVDFYCQTSFDEGFNNLFNDVRQVLEKEGYNVYTEVQDVKYSVLLEPYPTEFIINSKYKIRYRYSNISAKPNIVYLPQNYLKYDAILCSGKYDSGYLKALTLPYITGNQKYINFKKKDKKDKNKKILLYLPTYGKESSIDLISDKLNELRKDYYVIAKIHHGTSFLKDEIDRINKIKNSVDEFYDLHKDLCELLEIADVVLTDNSGSIFEALYTEVPVAIFADDINKNKKEGFNTTQYELYKKGILPFTNDINEIKKVLKQAQSKRIFNKQKEWNEENFYHPKNLVTDFVRVIEKYIKDDIDFRYLEMHNILKNDYYSLLDYKDKYYRLYDDKQKEIELLNKIIEDKNKQYEELNNKYSKICSEKEELSKINNNNLKRLKYYQEGKLYKLASKIYKIINGR